MAGFASSAIVVAGLDARGNLNGEAMVVSSCKEADEAFRGRNATFGTWSAFEAALCAQKAMEEKGGG